MRTYPKVLAIGLTLLTLSMAGPVRAEETPGPGPGGFVGEPGGPWGANRERFIEERMAQLHKELKLTSAQEADWQAWSDKVNQARAAKKEARPDFETLRKLPAPDRLQKMIDFGKTKQAELEDILTATKTFYATLTPEQRKTFDDLMPFGERGPGRHGHGGPHRPGSR